MTPEEAVRELAARLIHAPNTGYGELRKLERVALEGLVEARSTRDGYKQLLADAEAEAARLRTALEHELSTFTAIESAADDGKAGIAHSLAYDAQYRIRAVLAGGGLINEPNQSYTGRWPPWTPSEAERLTAEEARRILAAGWRYDVPASLVAKLERIAGGSD